METARLIDLPTIPCDTYTMEDAHNIDIKDIMDYARHEQLIDMIDGNEDYPLKQVIEYTENYDLTSEDSN